MAGIYKLATSFFSISCMVWTADIFGKGPVLRSSGKLSTGRKTNTGKRPKGAGENRCPLLFCIMLTVYLISGCSHSSEGTPAGSICLAANDFFAQGNYEASIDEYEKLIEKEPETADRVYFEMGIIYAHPKNDRKSYHKAPECFREIINDYPDSEYRRDSQMLMLQIQNVIIKDKLIAEQQT